MTTDGGVCEEGRKLLYNLLRGSNLAFRYQRLGCDVCNKVFKEAPRDVRYEPDALDNLVEHLRGKEHGKAARSLTRDCIQIYTTYDNAEILFNHRLGWVPGHVHAPLDWTVWQKTVDAREWSCGRPPLRWQGPNDEWGTASTASVDVPTDGAGARAAAAASASAASSEALVCTSAVIPKAAVSQEREGEHDLSQVVVNLINVGVNYGKNVLRLESRMFHWEGIRRCVQHLTRERGLKVIGVIFREWKGLDGCPDQLREVLGIPQDIRDTCVIQEVDRVGIRSADDEVVIRMARVRRCFFVDNDLYRDFEHDHPNPEIRHFLKNSKDHLHMRYFFDVERGDFAIFDGPTTVSLGGGVSSSGGRARSGEPPRSHSARREAPAAAAGTAAPAASHAVPSSTRVAAAGGASEGYPAPRQPWLAFVPEASWGSGKWLKCLLCDRWASDFDQRSGQTDTTNYRGLHGDLSEGNQKDHAKKVANWPVWACAVQTKRDKYHPARSTVPAQPSVGPVNHALRAAQGPAAAARSLPHGAAFCTATGPPSAEARRLAAAAAEGRAAAAAAAEGRTATALAGTSLEERRGQALAAAERRAAQAEGRLLH